MKNLRITKRSGVNCAALCTADAGYRIIRRAGAPLTLLTPRAVALGAELAVLASLGRALGLCRIGQEGAALGAELEALLPLVVSTGLSIALERHQTRWCARRAWGANHRA
jgi:hypothetical protein